MADFAPPTGPPPPKVPEGWKAVYNDQYKEWFYVNLYTKQSQWNKPTEPIYPPGDQAPGGPPPGYNNSSGTPMTGEKTTGAAMFGGSGGAGGHNLTADEELARKLQAEEDARAHGSPAGGVGSRGEADAYYQQPGPQVYGAPQSQYNTGTIPQGGVYGQPQQQYDQGSTGKSKGGLLGKLLGKGKTQQQGHPQQGYPQQGYPQHGYGGGGYPQQQYAQPGRKPGGGMGALGGAALGAGGGLLGGVLLADAFEGHHGGDGGGGYGGDDGGYGGDDGGGDYGGGDGGGDFDGGDGGGDFGGD